MANPKPKLSNLTNKGKGRVKGSKNKFTDIKKSFLEAFDRLGGVDALVSWGSKEKNRALFYQLVVRLVPKELEIDADIGNDVAMNVIYTPERKGIKDGKS